MALSAQIAKLQNKGKRGRGQDARRGSAKRRGRDHTPNEPTPQTASTAEECEHYCFAHGSQNSHKSADCRLMANQKERFTRAMRNATGPNNSPGGSTAVLGQTPRRTPTTVHGNMIQKIEETAASEDTTTAPGGHSAVLVVRGVACGHRPCSSQLTSMGRRQGRRKQLARSHGRSGSPVCWAAPAVLGGGQAKTILMAPTKNPTRGVRLRTPRPHVPRAPPDLPVCLTKNTAMVGSLAATPLSSMRTHRLMPPTNRPTVWGIAQIGRP